MPEIIAFSLIDQYKVNGVACIWGKESFNLEKIKLVRHLMIALVLKIPDSTNSNILVL